MTLQVFATIAVMILAIPNGSIWDFRVRNSSEKAVAFADLMSGLLGVVAIVAIWSK